MEDKDLYKDNIRDTHWLGEVMDNSDPANLGRCRIKVFGKFDQLPVDALPWATPMNRDHVGAHSIPRIGDILSVRFDNGNIYHPEYWFQVNQNKELKEEVLDDTSIPEDVISLVYDAERNVRILWSPDDGLTINTGSDLLAPPAIRFSNDGKMFLYSKNIFIASDSNEDEQQPAVRGKALSDVLQEILGFITTHTHTVSGPGATGPALPPVSINAKLLKSNISKNITKGKIQQKL